MPPDQKTGSNKQEAPADKSPFSMPAITLPKGGGAICSISKKFATFGPQLSLPCDSSASNGPFGLGWNLSLPSLSEGQTKACPNTGARETQYNAF